MKIGIVIFTVVIVLSIGVAMYMYTQYSPKIINVNEGEMVIVGPVKYTVFYEGVFNKTGTQIENTLMRISIIFENLGDIPTKINGGQFYILDENDTKYQAVFINFEDSDLLNVNVKPGQTMQKTTQFDVPFINDTTYRVGILPTKTQASTNIGMVCIINC